LSIRCYPILSYPIILCTSNKSGVESMTVIVNDDNVRIETMQMGPYGTNTCIVVCQETRDSLVVDAPATAISPR